MTGSEEREMGDDLRQMFPAGLKHCNYMISPTVDRQDALTSVFLWLVLVVVLSPLVHHQWSKTKANGSLFSFSEIHK